MFPAGEYSQTKRYPPNRFLPVQFVLAHPTCVVPFHTSCVKCPVAVLVDARSQHHHGRSRCKTCNDSPKSSFAKIILLALVTPASYCPRDIGIIQSKVLAIWPALFVISITVQWKHRVLSLFWNSGVTSITEFSYTMFKYTSIAPILCRVHEGVVPVQCRCVVL
jgi:hypothetical protein